MNKQDFELLDKLLEIYIQKLYLHRSHEPTVNDLVERIDNIIANITVIRFDLDDIGFNTLY